METALVTDAPGTSVVAGARKTIPFDYAVTFELKGEVNETVSGVINVSTVGTFVATAISYSFIFDRDSPTLFGPDPGLVASTTAPLNLDDVGENQKRVQLLRILLSQLPLTALKNGFRVSSNVLDKLASGIKVPNAEVDRAFEICGSEAVSFLYAIFDEGTGRAFQNDPIHNIAGLGIANGDRPFRVFPKPIVFRPRSVIRFQITALSQSTGTLYIVLQGYKVIGSGLAKRDELP